MVGSTTEVKPLGSGEVLLPSFTSGRPFSFFASHANKQHPWFSCPTIFICECETQPPIYTAVLWWALLLVTQKMLNIWFNPMNSVHETNSKVGSIGPWSLVRWCGSWGPICLIPIELFEVPPNELIQLGHLLQHSSVRGKHQHFHLKKKRRKRRENKFECYLKKWKRHAISIIFFPFTKNFLH